MSDVQFKRLMHRIKMEKSLRPLSKIQDYVKLVYQASFGSQHLTDDLDQFKLHLQEEMEHIEPDPSQTLLESIALQSPIARINLSKARANRMSFNDIFTLVMNSLNQFTPVSESEYMNRIKQLGEALRVAPWCFSHHSIDEFIKQYVSLSCPAVHHSEIYRKHYAPHYRLISPLLIDKLVATH